MLPALGQVIYTVSLIGGILATKVDQTTHIFGGHLGIAGPAWGVVAGALFQFADPDSRADAREDAVHVLV